MTELLLIALCVLVCMAGVFACGWYLGWRRGVRERVVKALKESYPPEVIHEEINRRGPFVEHVCGSFDMTDRAQIARAKTRRDDDVRRVESGLNPDGSSV